MQYIKDSFYWNRQTFYIIYIFIIYILQANMCALDFPFYKFLWFYRFFVSIFKFFYTRQKLTDKEKKKRGAFLKFLYFYRKL